MIKIQNNTATREPLPTFLRGLRPESLIDLSWTDSALGVADSAWWPEENGDGELPEDHRWGDEVLTLDTERRVVVVTHEIVPMTAEEIAEIVEAKKATLIEAATAKRWEVMTGGLVLPNGISVGTTVDDQNRITSVVANATLVGLTDADLVDFKAASGWVRISIGDVKVMAGAIGRFVQTCYTAERAHHEAIEQLETAEQLAVYDVMAGWPLVEGSLAT